MATLEWFSSFYGPGRGPEIQKCSRWRVSRLKIVEFEVRLGQDFTEINTHRMRAMKIWSVIKAWDHFKADIG